MIPINTLIRLAAVWLIVILFIFFGADFLNEEMTALTASIGLLILLITIIVASFGVVKEADLLASKLGEPYGTLILTLSIVAIEVILISAVLLGPGENPTIGKDSIFSVMMIILNLIIGLCILFGSLKYGELEYNAQGSMSYLGMIVVLGGVGMLLPNFIEGAGIYSIPQAVSISSMVIVLYGLFLYLQMKDYRHLYVQPPVGQLEIVFKNRNSEFITERKDDSDTKINVKEIWVRSIVLLGMIIPIVLLSHHLAVVVDYGITTNDLPPLLGGALIALIVFTPESITAIKAAVNNEFQRAINLCLGAFVSTVGLSIPAVLIVGLLTNKTVQFGMSSTETILFILTLVLSMMSFFGKRTTAIQGIMHLMLFALFVLLIFFP